MKPGALRWTAGVLALQPTRINRFSAVILAATVVTFASAGENASEREIFPRVWEFEFDSRVLGAPRKYDVVHAAMPRVVEFVGRSLAQPAPAR